jgi:calcineurin-like phosphoesterase family protein
MRRLLATGALALSLVIPSGAAAASDPVIAAAGDIACGSTSSSSSSCHYQATSDLLVGRDLDAVLPLGDLQYERGALDAFQRFYDPTWGRVKSITKPTPGNHEYGTSGAAGYFGYFGAAAGPPATGYYSYNLGRWHLISLNSNCGSIGGCGPTSPQVRWLTSDLASHRTSCTLAYWHAPHFSSGPHGDGGSTDDFWNTLYKGGADVILNGHDHDYERFGPQTPEGKAGPAFGIREFVVGTGGRSHYSFAQIKPNSQVRNDDTYGVLLLTLHNASYSWRFVPEAGGTFTDTGTSVCHAAPGTPVLRLSRAGRARLSGAGSLRVSARCAATCTAQVRASVTVGRRKLRSRLLRQSLAPERSVRLALKFSKRDRRALRAAFDRHKRLRVTISASAKDAAGKVGTATLKLRLRR